MISQIQNRRYFFELPFDISLHIFGLFLSVGLFWLFMQILTGLKPTERSFRRSISIIGFANIPWILGALIRLIYDISFYWPPSVTFNLIRNEISTTDLIVTKLVGWPLEIISFILLWSLVLVSYALRTLEVPRSRILIICILYTFMGLVRLANILYSAFIYL
ncbi:MAG: YIP1 family protein [Candidatus Hodarchaeota archaeon]